ncbi:hypothetical protein ACF0H5_020244 [Mactra antiquata]
MGKGKKGSELCMACGAAACCCFIVLIVFGLLGLGIAKIVMGAVHIHDCPIEKMIPIYLIVSGVAPIFFGGSSRNKDEDSESGSLARTICGFIGLLFNIAWLICGSIWVYPNYGKVNSDLPPCTGNMTTGCIQETCNKSLFTFAFAMVTIDWVLICLWIALIGCTLARYCCKG